MELSTIKIPEKVYVGFQGRRSVDEVPLGFMTPYTTDKAGEKRRATVDSWAKGHYHNADKTFNSVTIENKPMIGFKIGRAIRRSGSGWNSSGASFIRIEDPRGFELEITIENLAMCMAGNIIEDGELVQECVWGRDGGKNLLLPINSEPYLDSVSTKSAIDTAVPLRTVKQGDKIKLITGEEGIYFGGMFPVVIERYSSRGDKVTMEKKRYVLKQTDRHGVVTYVGRTAIKVGEVMEVAAAKLTPLEMETEIAAAVLLKKDCVVDEGRGYHRVIGYSGNDTIEPVNTDLILQNEADLKGMDYYSEFKVFAENLKGEYLALVSYENFRQDRNTPGRSYSYYKTPPGGNSWGYHSHSHSNYVTVTTNGWIGKKTTIKNGQISTQDNGDSTHFENDDTARLVAVQVTVKTKVGTQFSGYL